MTEPAHEDDELAAAEYALGVTSYEERQAFVDRLARERDLNRLLRFWDERFAVLANDIPEEAPPPRALRALETRLFDSVARARRGLDRRAPRGRSAAAFWSGFWAACAAIAGIFGLVYLLTEGAAPPPQRPAYVAQLSHEGEIRATALYESDSGVLRLTLSEPHAGAGDLELWLIAGQAAPVSLGLLPETSATLTLSAENRAALEGEAALAISLEPEGGSIIGAPTGPVVAIGNVTKV